MKNSKEKGKPFEKMGRKTIGPSVARQVAAGYRKEVFLYIKTTKPKVKMPGKKSTMQEN